MHFQTLTRGIAAAVALATLGLVNTAHAAFLPQNATINAVPSAQGGVLIASQSIPFAAPGFYAGTLLSQVYAGDPANALGGYTFVYQVSNTTGPGSIGRVTLNDYSNFLTDAGFVAATGVAPTFADRDSVPGDVVGFSFFRAPVGPGVVSVGLVSANLVVETNATAFQHTFASIIDGTVTTVDALAPAVPEPTVLSLVALGAAGMIRRRSR